MDLIDILWRQDIDLGVSREMFESDLWQEQEKEFNKDPVGFLCTYSKNILNSVFYVITYI